MCPSGPSTEDRCDVGYIEPHLKMGNKTDDLLYACSVAFAIVNDVFQFIQYESKSNIGEGLFAALLDSAPLQRSALKVFPLLD